jgi:hypothetical protein
VVTHQFEKLEKEKKEKEFKKRKVEQLDKLSNGEAVNPKKQNTLKAAFSKQDCSKVDQLWGRAFYANGLSFRLANDPHFQGNCGNNSKLWGLISRASFYGQVANNHSGA